MIFKCSNCDSALEFDPVSGMMQCLRCGSFFDVSEYNHETETDAVKEVYSFEADSWKDAEPETMEVKIYTCTSCGAELAVNDAEVSTWCSYCGQPAVVYSRVSEEQKPKYILPFKVTQEEAIHAVRQSAPKKWFLPDSIKNFEADKIRGIYVPYYLFDVYYNDYQNISIDTSNGKGEATTRPYSLLAECDFEQISCDASKHLPDESSQRLEPYNFYYLKEFHAAYLSGFYADRSDILPEQLHDVLIERCKEIYNAEVLRRYKRSSIVACDPRYKIKKAEYAMLPVWFLTFRYNNKPYTVMVNGQTGKVVGSVPMSKAKVTGLYWGIVFLIFILLILPFVLLGLSNRIYSDSWLLLFFCNIVLAACALFPHFIGIYYIIKYTRNMKLTRADVTAKYVKERRDKV